MKVEKIDSRYRLLHLIYEGKTSGILTDQSLRNSLNDLMKYELITIYNNKLRLTERGKNALKNGISSVITKVRPAREAEKTESNPQQLTVLMITISVIFLAILLFMVI